MNTLLEQLARLYPDSSRTQLRKWVKDGRVTVDDAIIDHPSFLVNEEQKVALLQKPKRRLFFKGIEILYQDRWIVVIDKPSGLLSVPADMGDQAHALGLVRSYLHTPAIFPVHRIDRETSGVLIFARGNMSRTKLSLLFEAHAIERTYLAAVEGHLPNEQGTWQNYLIEQENYDVIPTTEDKGKLAITHYSVYRRSKHFSFLKLDLETGRKHQIRVHCKEAGFPVLGDERYGSLCDPLGRLCLHAHRLGLVHPFTGEHLVFVSPLPHAFKKIGAHLCSEA